MVQREHMTFLFILHSYILGMQGYKTQTGDGGGPQDRNPKVILGESPSITTPQLWRTYQGDSQYLITHRAWVQSVQIDAALMPVQLCHGTSGWTVVPHLPLYLQDFDYKFSDSPHRVKATAQSRMYGNISPGELSNEKNGANVRTKTAKLIQLRAKTTAALLVHANHLALGTCLGS